MNKLLLKVRMIKNKKNGQINIAIPKKQLDDKSRSKIDNCRKAWITLEMRK